MAKLKVKTTQEQTVEIRASLSLSETFLEAEANAIASGRFSCFLRLKMRRRRSALYVAPAGLTLDAYLANGLTRTAFLKIITQTAGARAFQSCQSGTGYTLHAGQCAQRAALFSVSADPKQPAAEPQWVFARGVQQEHVPDGGGHGLPAHV